MFALSEITWWPVGAKAATDAQVLRDIVYLSRSKDGNTRSWACVTLGHLAIHRSTCNAVFALNPCAQLVSGLTDSDVDTRCAAIYALSQISRRVEGARAVVHVNALECTRDFLHSADAKTRRWTCKLLGNIASHQSLFIAVLTIRPAYASVWLVALSDDRDIGVSRAAIRTLSELSYWPEGAEAAVRAKALKHATHTLHSTDAKTRRWTCTLIGRLAKHPSTSAAVLFRRPCPQLVTLLTDPDLNVCLSALNALVEISDRKAGARATLDAKVLEQVPQLIDSADPGIQGQACVMLGKLIRHMSIKSYRLHWHVSTRMVSLLRDPDRAD
ncbi:armadillo-type protein [Mycena pura]|uniref:Armadillo-type protein n=1 Tax=Mycena pura TaxID=153505 RepID=A0AAD6Y985_9AGAR|nr:armadillo-type protein [Mycena pura]